MNPTATRLTAATLFLTLLCGELAHADPAPAAGLDENSLGLVGSKGIAPPVPPTVDAASAALYCRTMEVNARRYARWSTSWGWVFGVAAAGAVATGPIILATEGDSPSRRDRVLSLTVPAAGAILGYIASGLSTRAKDHGALAAQASLALNQPSPADEVVACNAALAAWNTARSESSQAIASVIAVQGGASAPLSAPSAEPVSPIPAPH
jgi:hypothetical protein